MHYTAAPRCKPRSFPLFAPGIPPCFVYNRAVYPLVIVVHAHAYRLTSVTMSDQCPFCGIVSGNIPSVKVAEDDATYAFLDINPASTGHLLVVPKRHSKDLCDIPADDLTAVTLAAQRIAKVAVAELDADGVNLLNCCGSTAWQSVYHFHMHVIPRFTDKSKDGLVLPWKPGVPAEQDKLNELGGRLSAALV